jgi:hypothetical protein
MNKMTSEEKIERIKELSRIEEVLKTNRDFEGLIKIHDESMNLFDSSMGNHTKRIPQKAYCLARLGRKTEAEKTLEGLKKVSFFADQDELYRAISLVVCFLTTSADELNLMQLNTIKNWLKDPQASIQVLQIVFDYSDFVGDIKPFDNSRLQTKQTYFSDELLECVFLAMRRNDETKIYYNRETNDVQQEVERYLTSHMASDQSAENRRLSSRIINSDSIDPIINGLHFLIPRLALSAFLEKFSENSDGYDELIDFIVEFESSIMEEYGDYADSIEDLVFSEEVSKSFFDELDKWYKIIDFDIEVLKEIIKKTKKSISIEFLIEVNQ